MSASLLFGLFAAVLAADAVGFFGGRVDPAGLTNAVRKRRDLKCENVVYSLCEGWVLGLARICNRVAAGLLKSLEKQGIDFFPWTAAEYMGLALVTAIGGGTGIFLGMVVVFKAGLSGAFSYALVGAAAVFGIQVQRIWSASAREEALVRSQLSFHVELMALLVEQGGVGIRDAIRVATQEITGSPVQRKFEKLLVSMELGESLNSALLQWTQNTPDEDLREFSLAVRIADQRGTPLAQTLRSLSEVLQVKRIARLEQAAERTKVQITWPAMLIVLACLLIIVAPFLLSVVETVDLDLG